LKVKGQTQGNVASRHLHRCSIFLMPGMSAVCLLAMKGTTGPAPQCLLPPDSFPAGLLGPTQSTEFGRNKGISTKKLLKVLGMSAAEARGFSCGCNFAKWSEVVKQQKFCLFSRNVFYCLFCRLVMPCFV